jgi:hypothetical protein
MPVLRGMRDVALIHYPSCRDSIKPSLQLLCNCVVINASEESIVTRIFFWFLFRGYRNYLPSEQMFTIMRRRVVGKNHVGRSKVRVIFRSIAIKMSHTACPHHNNITCRWNFKLPGTNVQHHEIKCRAQEPYGKVKGQGIFWSYTKKSSNILPAP